MTSIAIDLGTFDLYLDDVARGVAEQCDEEAMLIALATANEVIAKASGDEKEKAFAIEASKRLRELGEWFKVNQP